MSLQGANCTLYVKMFLVSRHMQPPPPPVLDSLSTHSTTQRAHRDVFAVPICQVRRGWLSRGR